MGTYLPDPPASVLTIPSEEEIASRLNRCTGCGAEGFGKSTLGEGYCHFCDGTENGESPDER